MRGLECHSMQLIPTHPSHQIPGGTQALLPSGYELKGMLTFSPLLEWNQRPRKCQPPRYETWNRDELAQRIADIDGVIMLIRELTGCC